MIKQITQDIQNNDGYVVTLDPKEGFSNVKIKANVTYWVKTVAVVRDGSTPTKPAVIPSPATNGSTDYYRAAANELVSFGLEALKGGEDQFTDKIQHLLIWCDGGNGLLSVVAH